MNLPNIKLFNQSTKKGNASNESILKDKSRNELNKIIETSPQFIMNEEESVAYAKNVPDAAALTRFDYLGGKSLVWNQFCKTAYFTKTITSDFSRAWFSTFNTFMIKKCIIGHKYYGKKV